MVIKLCLGIDSLRRRYDAASVLNSAEPIVFAAVAAVLHRETQRQKSSGYAAYIMLPQMAEEKPRDPERWGEWAKGREYIWQENASLLEWFGLFRLVIIMIGRGWLLT